MDDDEVWKDTKSQGPPSLPQTTGGTTGSKGVLNQPLAINANGLNPKKCFLGTIDPPPPSRESKNQKHHAQKLSLGDLIPSPLS